MTCLLVGYALWSSGGNDGQDDDHDAADGIAPLGRVVGLDRVLFAQAHHRQPSRGHALGGEHAYDPLGSLYSLLEHDTAGSFTDEFAEVPIDASQVIWVATANDLRGIPDPILNRMNVFDIDMPDEAAARKIASKLYRSIRADHDWGKRFEPDLREPVLAELSNCAPREMRRALMTAFGNAKLDGRYVLEVRDLPDQGSRKQAMGFVQ